jgi:hypothetical protein
MTKADDEPVHYRTGFSLLRGSGALRLRLPIPTLLLIMPVLRLFFCVPQHAVLRISFMSLR